MADSGRYIVSTIPVDSDHGARSIGKLILAFYAYVERPKQSPYAIWASFLVCTAPGLQGGLELELFWASSLGTRTK